MIIRKVIEFVVAVGAIKALIPTAPHLFELGEVCLAAVVVGGAFALRYAYGQGTKQATSSNEAQAPTNR